MRNILIGLAVAASAVPQASIASDYGCRVLLCLAAVNGTPQECRPDLKKLFRDLSKGRPFPTCDFVSASAVRGQLQRLIDDPATPDEQRQHLRGIAANAGNSFARQGYGYYDPCPEGTTALGKDLYAVQGTAEDVSNKSRFGFGRPAGDAHRGIGEGNDLAGFGFGHDSALPGKVCVASHIGNTWVRLGLSSRGQTPVRVYERVVLVSPAATPRFIDVFIDDTLYRRVRW